VLYPSIDKLVDMVDSKYSLVVAASKRARYLQELNLTQPNSSTTKNVTRALWEIYNGSVYYTRVKESDK